MKKDTYRITVGETGDLPSDAYDTEEELCQAAIDLARENARLYVMPATWTAERRGDVIVVTRYRA